jgi:N utilization substance protein A
MTPEQLEEVPGIGEKTLEKIGTAVRHYFAQLDAASDADAGPLGTESSEAEDRNEAALDKQAGAGSDEQAAETEDSGVAEEIAVAEPGEVPILDIANEVELTETGEISELGDSEGEGDSQTLMKNFLEDATATEADDEPVSVDAMDPREPELDAWEEKEKP